MEKLLQALVSGIGNVLTWLERIAGAQAAHQFTRTRFVTVPLKPLMKNGIPIGQGKCKAVRLKANIYTPDTNTKQATGKDSYFCYGDQRQQESQYLLPSSDTDNASAVLTNQWTPKIYCKDLSEVYLRFPLESITNAELLIEVMILD